MLIYRLLNWLDDREFRKQHMRLLTLGGKGKFPAKATGYPNAGDHKLIVEVSLRLSGDYPQFWQYPIAVSDPATSTEADAAATKMIRAWYRQAFRIGARKATVERALQRLRRILT